MWFQDGEEEEAGVGDGKEEGDDTIMTAGRSGCPDDDDIRVFCFPFTSAWKEEDKQSRKRQNLHDDDQSLGTLKSNGPLQGRISMRTRREKN